ncbi:Replicase polyprotein 1a [Dirofilaria immitis]
MQDGRGIGLANKLRAYGSTHVKVFMLTTLVEKTFIRALRGEITDEEAADQIAGSLCVDSLTNNLQNYVNGVEVQHNVNNVTKMDTSANLQSQLCQQQQQPKVLGTITLGDLHPAQIAQFQQAFTEASKGLASSVVFNVPVQKVDNSEECFTEEDKERCALLQELITGQRPLILHPYVFLLNRRFKWTDIAVPVTETDKFRVYRLNQARNSRCYYRCSGCETMAKEPGDPIAQIKLAEGNLAGDVNPVHNSKCELFTFSNIVNRQFDREARLDVYNGIMSPKEAWNRGRLRALRAESLVPKGLLNADEYPTWETMNKVIMKLWRSAKRAHDAGIENIDRVGSKDWWRNIPPPSSSRRGMKKENYDNANYTFRPEGSGGIEELDDDGDGSCISMAAGAEDGCLELLDVVSESEVYTTDQEPAPSGSFERNDIVPEPPEQISLFSNRSDPNKRILHQDNHVNLSTLPNDASRKAMDVFMRNNEENTDVQYYLLQGYDEDDDDDNEDDDDDGDDDNGNGDGNDDDGDGDEDRERNDDDEDDNDNDVDVDNVDQVNVDNADDEVMREYNDVLTEVDRLERKAIAATGGMIEHRRMGGGHIVEQRQRGESYELRRSIQQPLHEHALAPSQQLNSTFFANRKLFAAIESLTRTLNTDHSRQFHQEMLKTAVELSNSYAAQQRQRYAAATVTLRRNATVEHRNVATAASRQHSDYEDDEKSFGKVIGRRQARTTPLRTWAFKKGSKFGHKE